MGLRVSVYRQAENEFSRSWPCDTTNGGITSRYSDLCVVNVEGPFEPTDDCPAVMLVKGALRTVILVPAELIMPGEWLPVPGNTKEYAGPMFGGNYAATSDSRFSEAIHALGCDNSYMAVPVHDRFDTWADYEALTR